MRAAELRLGVEQASAQTVGPVHATMLTHAQAARQRQGWAPHSTAHSAHIAMYGTLSAAGNGRANPAAHLWSPEHPRTLFCLPSTAFFSRGFLPTAPPCPTIATRVCQGTEHNTNTTDTHSAVSGSRQDPSTAALHTAPTTHCNGQRRWATARNRGASTILAWAVRSLASPTSSSPHNLTTHTH